MKLLSLIAAIVLLALPISAPAAPGWNRNITVEWEYIAPADLTVTGFKLYQDGLPTCEWNIPIVRIGNCDVILTTKITKYTIAAVFNDGNLSPQSDPYLLMDWGPKPKINSVISK